MRAEGNSRGKKLKRERWTGGKRSWCKEFSAKSSDDSSEWFLNGWHAERKEKVYSILGERISRKVSQRIINRKILF